MILDLQQRLSNAQAFSASGGSTDVIDLGEDRNVGIGEPLGVLVCVDTAADTAHADETYQFGVRSDGSNPPTTEIIARVIARASLTAGSKWVIPIPPGTETGRYLYLYLTLGGTTPSITITAYLVPLSMIQNDAYYADAITIS